ncbi:MAG: LacI family DNA-binding transcriptional regulator, partial [Lachnospiraceae bacterium]|nr:LacI family DNA-binding transcriptional regulator [Lachnospiraceae bacterium]
MKSIKRIVAVLLAVLMAVTFCACKGSENGSTDPDKKDGPDDSKNVKIGVLVSDVTSAEALAFRAYYEEYIQKQYNVTFMYSDELADAAAEASAIDNFIANNCKAIISFASADRPAQIEQCEQNGVYYAVATGTLTDEQYEKYKTYEHYVGAIGPDLYTEYMAGYNMAKYYLDQGFKKFGMFGGATPYYTDMHIYRAAGM